jgi:hypothetical protein
MARVLVALALSVFCTVCLTDQALADPSKTVRGAVWVQHAFGQSIGDDLVSGEVDADISVSEVPIIGSVGATLPVAVGVAFEDPSGILVGGELIAGHIGFECGLAKGGTIHRGRFQRGSVGGSQLVDEVGG